MLNLIRTEFKKMKRYHILLIGIIGMACSPLLQLFTQAIVAEEYKNPHFDLSALIQNTIWGNATIFMPVLLTLIGGYLINREYTDDTLKNILTIPISFQKLLTGKSAAIGLISVLLNIYCFIFTVILGTCAGLSGAGIPALLKGLLQMVGLAVSIYIAVLPLITICSRIPGMFMGGSVTAFILGYCCMFFKQGLPRDIYPFSAALTVIGFDTAAYAGTLDKGSIPLSLVSLGTMLLISAFAICAPNAPGTVENNKKSKGKRIFLRPAQREKI